MFENKRLVNLSLNNERDDKDIILKITEEVGEVAQAYLSVDGSKGSEYREHTLDDVKEEIVDVMMVAFSLFLRMGTKEDFNEILEEKLDKWEKLSK